MEMFIRPHLDGSHEAPSDPRDSYTSRLYGLSLSDHLTDEP